VQLYHYFVALINMSSMTI